MKIEFDHYRIAYETVKAAGLGDATSVLLALGRALGAILQSDMDDRNFYEAVRRGFLGNARAGQRVDRAAVSQYRQMMEEYRWLRIHKPRYRIYPNMVQALAKIAIDIDAKHFKLPFPTLTIDMPKDYLRENDSAPFLRGMMVHCRWKNDPEPDKFNYGVNFTDQNDAPDDIFVDTPATPMHNVMIVDLDFGDETYKNKITETVETNACKPFAIFDLVEGKTISECFDGMPEPMNWVGGYLPSLEFQKTCLRIAVGAAFLAVNNNEFVERDLPQGFAEKLDRAKSSKNKKLLEKTQNQIAAAGLSRTFAVGREIVIPQQHEPGDPSPAGEPTGRHLHWAHVRSGYMRFQPYGSREDPQYKLIFVHPTIVRPDLPLQPTPPRAIK
jgi:hypothetical protein